MDEGYTNQAVKYVGGSFSGTDVVNSKCSRYHQKVILLDGQKAGNIVTWLPCIP